MTKKGLPSLVWIIIGFVILEFSETVQYLIQPLFFPTLLRIIGMAIIIFNLAKSSFTRLNSTIRPVFNFMIIWSIIIVLRGSFVGNYLPGQPASLITALRHALLDPYGAFALFIPLIALIKFNNKSLYYFGRIALLLCVIALGITIYTRSEIAVGMVTGGNTSIVDSEGNYLSVRYLIHAAYPGFGLIVFSLFCYNYINNKLSIILPISIFVFFISYAIGGGRGMTVFSLLYLIIFFYLVYKYPNVSQGRIQNGRQTRLFRRISYLILIGVFVFLLLYLFYNTEVFDFVLERAFGGKTLDGDFQNDSRNVLVNAMREDFNNHPLDWIWGRGVNGSYHTTHLSINGLRAWMEISYYYLILKGGIIYLFLYIYCIAHAMYLGLFKSHNVFARVLGIMCAVLLINLVSASAIPQYSTLFMISWLCFGLVERREIRMMSDEDIYGYFNVKNYNRKGL